MATSKNEFVCSICQNLYTNPVVHRLCGYSFDRQCIKNICPAQECGQVIKDDDLVINHALLKVVKEHRFRSEMRPAYYLILLDRSSSMWYSDAFLPFATGESRFKHAIHFLYEFFNMHMNLPTSKISLYTFDTDTLQRFDFETINATHLTMLNKLTCEGKDTALFDSIDFCLDKLEKFKQLPENEMATTYLFILTDGGNNFGKAQSEHAIRIEKRSRKLQILGHMIQIGNTNRRKTRMICDFLKYKYNHFHNGNVREFVNSFTNTVRAEAQAPTRPLTAPTPSRVQPSQLRSVTDVDLAIISQLPDVPTHKVKISSKQSVLA